MGCTQEGSVLGFRGTGYQDSTDCVESAAWTRRPQCGPEPVCWPLLVLGPSVPSLQPRPGAVACLPRVFPSCFTSAYVLKGSVSNIRRRLSREHLWALVSGLTGNAARPPCRRVSFIHLLCVSPSSEHGPPFLLWARISFLRVGGFRAERSSACVPQATLATGAPPALPQSLPGGKFPAPGGASSREEGGLGPRRPPWCVQRACTGPVHFTGSVVVIIINLFLITEVINVNHLNNWR